jgi:hypothetical protein
MQACHVTKSFFYGRFHATTAVKSFFLTVSIHVRQQQCGSGKQLRTMQASHEAQTQPSYMGSPIPENHAQNKKRWLRFFQPHQAIFHRVEALKTSVSSSQSTP